MRPHQWPLPDKTPLGLLAQFGSSRVREDLPRLVREVGPSRTSSANRSPAPTDANLVRRFRSMRCGRGKRDLGSPRAAIPSVRIHRTPRIGINQSSFSSRENDLSHRRPDHLAGESSGFALRRRDLFGLVWSAGIAPRDRATQPISLHSRPLEASWRPRETSGADRCRSGSPEPRSERISRESGLDGRLAQAHADPRGPQKKAMGGSWRAVSSFAMELN